MTSVEWRWVKGFEYRYEVSNLGQIRSYARQWQRVLTGSKNQDGYVRVGLCKSGVEKERSVHQLVAEAFLGWPVPGLEINHKDGNPSNNKLENLELVTHQENILDMRRRLGSTVQFGRKKKFTPDQVAEIRKLRARGIGVKTLGSKFGVSFQTISKIARGSSAAYSA